MAYEEDVARHGYFVKTWLRYLSFKSAAPAPVRYVIYERAVAALPRSYKLWRAYLDERVAACRSLSPRDSAIDVTSGAFERALSTLHTMPMLWKLYCEFLASHDRITATRHAYDRALRALPLAQHHILWEDYLAFARQCRVPETAVRVYRRYLQYAPEAREELVEYLLEAGFIDEAAKELVALLEDPSGIPAASGRTRLQMWQQLCELIALHPDEVPSLKGRVEGIVRAGIERFPEDDTGRLWTGLANHYVGLGMFDKARDMFEEGISKVMKVRDFALIWDAYAEFEEGLLQTLLESRDTDAATFQLQTARYESVLDRRPFMISSVLLRQNPHNVNEWLHRINLYREKKDWRSVARTFKQAIKTVDPARCKGKLSSLHAGHAQFFEHHGEIEKARKIFTRALEVPYVNVDELASVYCARVEMEICNLTPKIGLDILRQVCVVPPAHLRDLRGLPVQDRIYRSTKLWCLYADLEESIGTPEGVRAAYDGMLDLKIATPRVVLCYAAYLEQHKFFEDAYKAYERGVDMFDFPHSLEIWIAYLTKFVQRYKGTKIERTRDIFEQAIERVPPEHAKTIYIMYADFEERYGLARHAMSVYDRAARAVPPEEQYVMYLLYIERATDFFGVSRSRDVYEKAISVLPDKYMQDVCLRYADLEKRLGEVDRSRAIYRHCANYCDPRSAANFWQTWHNFEVSYGNEETFREMLRLKRSVQAKFDTKIPALSSEAIAALQAKIQQEVKGATEAGRALPEGAKARIAAAAAAITGGGGAAGVTAPVVKLPQLGSREDLVGDDEDAAAHAASAPGTAQITFSAPPVMSNSRELDIDDDDMNGNGGNENDGGQEGTTAVKRERNDDDDEDDGHLRLVQQKVPAAVFGSVAAQLEEVQQASASKKKKSKK